MDDMNDDYEAKLAFKLSQMMDGELNREETKSMVLAIEKNKALRAKWQQWHLVREILQSEEIILQAKRPKVQESHELPRKDAL